MYVIVKNGQYWTGYGWTLHLEEAQTYDTWLQRTAAEALTGGTAKLKSELNV